MTRRPIRRSAIVMGWAFWVLVTLGSFSLLAFGKPW